MHQHHKIALWLSQQHSLPDQNKICQRFQMEIKKSFSVKNHGIFVDVLAILIEDQLLASRPFRGCFVHNEAVRISR
jgi:hypothetical protein